MKQCILFCLESKLLSLMTRYPVFYARGSLWVSSGQRCKSPVQTKVQIPVDTQGDSGGPRKTATLRVCTRALRTQLASVVRRYNGPGSSPAGPGITACNAPHPGPDLRNSGKPPPPEPLNKTRKPAAASVSRGLSFGRVPPLSAQDGAGGGPLSRMAGNRANLNFLRSYWSACVRPYLSISWSRSRLAS